MHSRNAPVQRSRPCQVCRRVAVQIDDLAVHMLFDIGQGRDPIDEVAAHGLLKGAAHHQVTRDNKVI